MFLDFTGLPQLLEKLENWSFFEVLLGKLENDTLFFVDFPSATKCTFTTTVIFNLQFSLTLRLSKKVIVSIKTKFVALVFIDTQILVAVSHNVPLPYIIYHKMAISLV